MTATPSAQVHLRPYRLIGATMNLTALRALLRAAGLHRAELDRVDVKRQHGEVVGVDVMLTSGTVTFLPVVADRD